MYQTKRWRKKRQYILSRDNYECRESKRYGKSVLANTVHHIYPVEKYPELAFKDWNLISLSQDVHNSFHDRKSDAVIGQGLYWQRRYRKLLESHKEDTNEGKNN